MFTASAQDRTGLAQDRHADPRVATTITTLAVMMAAALCLVPTRQHASNLPDLPQTAAVGGGETASGPVKMIGATPRSENCADQVCPYIEPRCLTRAPAKPVASAGSKTQPGAP